MTSRSKLIGARLELQSYLGECNRNIAAKVLDLDLESDFEFLNSELDRFVMSLKSLILPGDIGRAPPRVGRARGPERIRGRELGSGKLVGRGGLKPPGRRIFLTSATISKLMNTARSRAARSMGIKMDSQVRFKKPLKDSLTEAYGKALAKEPHLKPKTFVDGFDLETIMRWVKSPVSVGRSDGRAKGPERAHVELQKSEAELKEEPSLNKATAGGEPGRIGIVRAFSAVQSDRDSKDLYEFVNSFEIPADQPGITSLGAAKSRCKRTAKYMAEFHTAFIKERSAERLRSWINASRRVRSNLKKLWSAGSDYCPTNVVLHLLKEPGTWGPKILKEDIDKGRFDVVEIYDFDACVKALAIIPNQALGLSQQ